MCFHEKDEYLYSLLVQREAGTFLSEEYRIVCEYIYLAQRFYDHHTHKKVGSKLGLGVGLGGVGLG